MRNPGSPPYLIDALEWCAEYRDRRQGVDIEFRERWDGVEVVRVGAFIKGLYNMRHYEIKPEDYPLAVLVDGVRKFREEFGV